MGELDKRILVIEDEDAIRALLFTILRRRGFQVDTARNGADGLERFSRCRYAVVLLDLMMPLMNGYEFLDELAKRPASERPLIIVLTAGAIPRSLDPEVVAGTMRKPFDIELLVDSVRACLETVIAAPQPDGCPPAESESESLRTRDREEPN